VALKYCDLRFLGSGSDCSPRTSDRTFRWWVESVPNEHKPCLSELRILDGNKPLKPRFPSEIPLREDVENRDLWDTELRDYELDPSNRSSVSNGNKLKLCLLPPWWPNKSDLLFLYPLFSLVPKLMVCCSNAIWVISLEGHVKPHLEHLIVVCYTILVQKWKILSCNPRDIKVALLFRMV